MIKKQILQFALKNWKAIAIILLLVVVAMKNRRDYSLMQKAYETQAESHIAQIADDIGEVYHALDHDIYEGDIQKMISIKGLFESAKEETDFLDRSL